MDHDYIDNEYETEEKVEPKKKSRIWSVLALIVAVLSVVLFFVPAVSITLGIVAVALTVVSRLSIGYFDNYGIAAIIVGIFGVVFGISYIVYDLLIAAAVL